MLTKKYFILKSRNIEQLFTANEKNHPTDYLLSWSQLARGLRGPALH
jgi:hypothetical protein